ncbi:transthyretin family protein [Plesiocystis pacifica SIR-1]|uniref:5-hydroxyisourate hydrolase n=1 Tax=Plesiocystis pacifica SIR-1 TaxID=391625 RepID=A6G7W3_9BACT|nr:hydroxyisourate hydrolase [Plesiocystis pacifica]EDM78056.1 transthyretin family protein [Plesiocystis pacifica SIR-1]
MSRSPITTHILDTALGRPAAGVTLTLDRRDGAAWTRLGEGVTNDDGRVTDLLAPGSLEAGVYRIEFEVAAYFARTARESFYPSVSVEFEVRATDEHYHVPLLLNPFGYSTYRGS